MNKEDRKQAQKKREAALILPDKYVVKGESLFERARKFGWAVNDPLSGNRAQRRKDIRDAIIEDRRG